MDAGYSGTPLPKKLNVPPNGRYLTLRVPDAVLARIGVVGETEVSPTTTYDWIIAHHLDRQSLQDEFVVLMRVLEKTGCLWIAWPKKSSSVETDLNENVIRDIGLEAGLVDTKVCAIDETWSGLKFMWRLVDR